MEDLTSVIKESFIQYSGAVLQSRALVDARDCLKPSARQIFYCLYTDKFLHSKPMKKTLKAVGSASRMYIHGDSSCVGVIMRAAQPWAMRYPLIEVEGGIGQPTETGNWSSPRYTSSRLSELSSYLFRDIDKDTIKEWRDNYDDTEQYPSVLPTKGFYNIVNGSAGIGIGMSSNLPQFRIQDVNEALIHLLWNPDCEYDDIYCCPDFATGGYLLNEAAVKESLKKGSGAACKLRAMVSYDSKERCLIVTEVPYSVYTNTICAQLHEIIESEENPGIERYNDLTKLTPCLKIYLKKSANPDVVLKYLYKNTSLEYHYGINLTVLENGRFPRVMTWRELLQSYIDHQIVVYTRGYEFDLGKIMKRLHIIEGLLLAIASIDEVVKIIKSAKDTKEASTKLQSYLSIDEVQAKAILDIKLARLAHLEVTKLQSEQKDLLTEKARIEEILNNSDLLKKEIEKDLRAVATKFGDSRRTKILNLNETENEAIEEKKLLVSFTNQGNLFVQESSTLYTQKRGGVGTKFKLNPKEFIVDTLSTNTTNEILFFTANGEFFHRSASLLPIGEKFSTVSLGIMGAENIVAVMSLDKKDVNRDILFFTKKGLIKRSAFSEYKMNRSGLLKAIELNEGDEICCAFLDGKDKIGVLTELGQFLYCDVSEVRSVSRVSKGVRCIKLNDGDNVVSVRPIPVETKSLLFITGEGYTKRTPLDEFSLGSRGNKGGKPQKLSDSDYMIDFLPLLSTDKEVTIITSRAQISLDCESIPLQLKDAQGVKSIKFKTLVESVVGLYKS